MITDLLDTYLAQAEDGQVWWQLGVLVFMLTGWLLLMARRRGICCKKRPPAAGSFKEKARFHNYNGNNVSKRHLCAGLL